MVCYEAIRPLLPSALDRERDLLISGQGRAMDLHAR